MNVREFLKGLPEPAHALVARRRAFHAFEDHDIAVAAEALEQVPRNVETEVVVVRDDDRRKLAARHAIVVVDDRNADRVDLLDRRHDAVRIHAHEQHGVRLLHADVLQLAQLLAEIVRARRRVVRDRHAELLCLGVDTRADEREMRIDLVLVESGDRLACRKRARAMEAADRRRRRGDDAHRGPLARRLPFGFTVRLHPLAPVRRSHWPHRVPAWHPGQQRATVCINSDKRWPGNASALHVAPFNRPCFFRASACPTADGIFGAGTASTARIDHVTHLMQTYAHPTQGNYPVNEV